MEQLLVIFCGNNACLVAGLTGVASLEFRSNKAPENQNRPAFAIAQMPI